MTDRVLDVAIVGAGIAGVYAGWRLVTQRGNCQVVIFEASHRVGGRLYSVTPPGVPDAKVELGGQRILPESEQPRINSLIRMLNEDAAPGQGIETFALPDDSPPENIANVRGTHLRREDFKKDAGCQGPSCVPFKTSFAERGQAPSDILLKAFEQVVPGITRPSLTPSQRRAMTRGASFGGRPLQQQEFLEVLLRVLSHEAYELVTSSGGYERGVLTGNAADGIAAFLTEVRAARESRGFKQGFQQVPTVLAERFKQHGGEIRCNMPLVGFDWKHGCAELHFDGHPVVKAQSVVLALPPRALEKLASSSPLLRDEAVSKLTASVTLQPKVRFFAQYADTWWKAAGVSKGSSVTDRPVGKMTCWPKSGGGNLRGDAESLETPIMKIEPIKEKYIEDFWFVKEAANASPKRPAEREDSAHLPAAARFIGHRERMGQGAEVDPEWTRHTAPADMVGAFASEVPDALGLTNPPEVQEAIYKLWPGRGCWNPGVDSKAVSDKLVEPMAGVPISIVNGDFSLAPGSVEGSLQHVDEMLKKRFSVSPLVADEER